MRHAIKNDKQGDLFKELVSLYRSMFSDMDDFARAAWFSVMDESEILSFDVGRGETIEQAEQRHNVKLLAIAAALESLPCAAKEKSTIDSLRSMVNANEKRREPMPEGSEPPPGLSDDAQDILEQTYQTLVREHLTVLGLASRIEGADVQDDGWLRLLKLTFSVIECASHTPPTSSGQFVCIDSMLGPPDAAGWITTSSQVHPPYWIAKTDLHKLQALEATLDGLVRRTRH